MIAHHAMSVAEKRVRLIMLSCEIEDAIVNVACLVGDPTMRPNERDQAEANLKFFRQSLERVEAMLCADDANTG